MNQMSLYNQSSSQPSLQRINSRRKIKSEYIKEAYNDYTPSLANEYQKPPISRRGQPKLGEGKLPGKVEYMFDDQEYRAGQKLQLSQNSYHSINLEEDKNYPQDRSMLKHYNDQNNTQIDYSQFPGNTYGEASNGNADVLYLEYLSLIDPQNTQELVSYGVQSLAPLIEDSIYQILTSKSSYMRLLNLIELNLTSEDKPLQKKILDCLARNLTEDRAKDGMSSMIIERILKFYNRQGTEFHNTFSALILTHIKQSGYQVRLGGLIEMLKSNYINLQDLALKVMREVSEPTLANSKDFSIQFENHIRYLLECCMSQDRAGSQINTLLQIIANLSINDYLVPEILHHRGIETLLYHLREKANVEGQRLAAKALLNIGAKSRDNKLLIIPELNYELKAMHRGELDELVRGYIATLIQSQHEKQSSY